MICYRLPKELHDLFLYSAEEHSGGNVSQELRRILSGILCPKGQEFLKRLIAEREYEIARAELEALDPPKRFSEWKHTS